MCDEPAAETTHLPLDPGAAGAARRFLLAAMCPGQRADADSAMLLVSELVTNAVRYGSPPISLSVLCSTLSGVYVEVSNTGEPWQAETAMAGPDAEGGRGLALVDMLCSRAGRRNTPSINTAWFALDAP